MTQRHAARRAGLSQSGWSQLETAGDARFTLGTWDRAAHAVGATLDAFLRHASAATAPRDAVHLRHQELVIRTALAGGWRALPEEMIDRDARTSRAADVLLHRRRPGKTAEYALGEIFDWFADVGAPTRDWWRRLDAVERYAVARMRPDDALPRVGGCWIVRATTRNRALIGEHRLFFRSRFPGSGRLWLAALATPGAAMPADAALLWVAVDGTRLYPARLS
ncbi:hypothetical protein BH24CHL5_BH24CHL5_06780 [soil metagenome]